MNVMSTAELVKIPLSKLRPSPRNVRKTGGASIDDLAASILAHKLIQNLTVSQANDGFFEVEAGSRRLRAMQKLASEKKIPADYEVHCRVVTPAEAPEANLAENQLREAMHPADQFLAIKALVDAKLAESEIAARFGVTPRFVQQRMKLAKVSPKIIQAYRDDKITLDAVEACALSDDHEAQERAIKQGHGSEWQIRQLLTKGEVEATDKRVKFVGGLDAYEAAGGAVRRDLFDERNAGYVVDVKLLDKLVEEKFAATTEKLQQEGWGWVEVAFSLDDWRYNTAPKGTDKAKAGAIAFVTYDGKIEIKRNVLKPGQKAPSDNKTASETKPKKAGLSADMVRRLELHRAAAIRQHIAGDPSAALQLLLAQMLTALLVDRHAELLLGLTPRNEHQHAEIDIRAKFSDLSLSPARKALDERIAQWRKAGLPSKASAMPAWIASLTEAKRLELLALATALLFDTNAGQRGAAVAATFNVDMRDWWKPSPEFYLSIVPKALLAEAVTEVAGKDAGEKLLTLKKDAAIADAAKHLDGAGWLPKPLRHAGYQVRKGASAESPKVAPAKPATKKAAKKIAAKKATPAKKAKAPAKKKATKR